MIYCPIAFVILNAVLLNQFSNLFCSCILHVLWCWLVKLRGQIEGTSRLKGTLMLNFLIDWFNVNDFRIWILSSSENPLSCSFYEQNDKKYNAKNKHPNLVSAKAPFLKSIGKYPVHHQMVYTHYCPTFFVCLLSFHQYSTICLSILVTWRNVQVVLDQHMMSYHLSSTHKKIVSLPHNLACWFLFLHACFALDFVHKLILVEKVLKRIPKLRKEK